MRIKNNESKKIVELTGSDTGGTIRLNNKLEQTKLFMSSQDEELNQGIIKLYGEDDKVKIMVKAKSSIDNMSGVVSGDRKTGGLIQFNSYDSSHEFFITANNENNFGMYDKLGSAFEINSSTNATIMSNKRLSSISLIQGGMSLNVTDLNSLRIAWFKSGEIKGEPDYIYRLPALFKATSTFSGTTGTTITHNLNTTDYVVSVTPIGKSSLTYVGEVSIEKGTNTVTIYNSGSSNPQFDCIILK